MAITGCAVQPYDSKFNCPPTYGGLCESLPDAYEDSVHDVDPRMFDDEWLKKKKEWEKKNVELLMARQAAGIDVKTVTPPEELFEDKNNGKESAENSKGSGGNVNGTSAKNKDVKDSNEVGERKGDQKASDLELPSYRELVFREMKELLVQPEKPLVVPPKVVRVLVLSNITKDRNSQEMYISPHYVYFFLDKPHFLLHKYPETVPFDPENPFKVK